MTFVKPNQILTKMKNVIILLFVAISCFSCSSDSKEEKTSEFACQATYYHYLTGRSDMRCQFYFFPNGNYTKVVRNTSFEMEALPWNAYAITSTGEVVYSVMQANSEKEWATPYAVNGYKGSTTKGSFYVVAFPYGIRDANGKYLMYNCYKAKSFQKKDDATHCSIMPTFSFAELSDCKWFDGEKSEPIKLEWK